MSEITQITSGNTHACALKSNGNAYCWGYGVLENWVIVGTIIKTIPFWLWTVKAAPRHWQILSKLELVIPFSCAVSSSGGVHCWGAETYGRLGNNRTDDIKNYPVPVLDSAGATASAITAISKISVSQYHTCALKMTANYSAGDVERMDDLETMKASIRPMRLRWLTETAHRPRLI